MITTHRDRKAISHAVFLKRRRERVVGPLKKLFVETDDNSSHDIALFKILLRTSGMRVVTGHAGFRDGKIGRQSLKLIPFFKGENSSRRIRNELF